VGFTPEQLAAFAPMYGDLQARVAAGPMPGAGGGSRGSKAPKKKEDDDATFTTVMLRNIPNKYTQQMLIDQLHRTGFQGEIDYLYLPIDFANRCNCGYCFINFRTVAARQRFAAVFDNVAVQSCLPGFNSYKVCQVTRAKWQGRDESVRRLRSGPELMAQLAAHPDWLPLLLDEKGEQEPFPVDNHGQAPVAPLRRRGAKGGGLQFPGFADPGPLADGGFLGGGRGGKGAGRGGNRGRRALGRGALQITPFGGMPAYPGLASLPAYAGMPGVPVMTEQGLQYMPYGYSGYGVGGFMPPPYAAGAYGNNWYEGLAGAAADWQGLAQGQPLQQPPQQSSRDDATGGSSQQAMARGSPRRVDLGHGDDDSQAVVR